MILHLKNPQIKRGSTVWFKFLKFYLHSVWESERVRFLSPVEVRRLLVKNIVS